MSVDMKDPLILKVSGQLESLCKRVDDKIEKKQQQLKACKEISEMEEKLAQEIKLHNELTSRLAELCRREGELQRVCVNFDKLTIADSDKNRLDHAKELYQIGKELTGVRFDFSATPNVAKGYVKSSTRKVLSPFEIPMDSSAGADTLWALIHSTVAGDKENLSPNQ